MGPAFDKTAELLSKVKGLVLVPSIALTTAVVLAARSA
jgi:hypothetical protein